MPKYFDFKVAGYVLLNACMFMQVTVDSLKEVRQNSLSRAMEIRYFRVEVS